MLAATAGQHAPGRRKVVVALERGERTVAIVARVDVEHDQLVGDDAEIGVRLVGEPFPDRGLVGRGVKQPVGDQPPKGCFAGERQSAAFRHEHTSCR